MRHFHRALDLLKSSLTRSSLRGGVALVYHSMKQYRRYRFPPNSSTTQPQKDEPFLERARCLAHISHIYRIQNKSIMGFMTAFKRLNEAEDVQDYFVHEVSACIRSYGSLCVCACVCVLQVMEAYADLIEHCQQQNFGKLANYYFNKAIA